MKNNFEASEDQWQKKVVRKNVNKVARGILLYEVILLLTVIVDMFWKIVPFFSEKSESDLNFIADKILTEAMNSGTSSIIGIFLGLFFLLFYFRKCDYRKFIFHSQEKMTGLSFLILLTVFMSAQTIFSLSSLGLESCFNRFGLSILGEIESASSTSSTLSMLLYASFIGPIAEELVFRGFVMRGLQKYGAYYAILISSLIFGAFHGNLIQSIFAALVGLVLGYVALNYSIIWSILLHIINNFIFGDLLSHLVSNLDESIQSGIILGIEGVFFAGTIVIIMLKRSAIMQFIKSRKVKKGLFRLTFTSIWLLIFLAFQTLAAISGIEKLPM